MKNFLLIILLSTIVSGVLGQSRLDPGDSLVNKQDWYIEHPFSVLITSSLLSGLSFNTGYSEFYDYLERQDIDSEKILQTFSFGMGIRWRKSLLAFEVSQTIPSNDQTFSNTLDGTVDWDQSLQQLNVSFGYVLFSNSYLTVIPKAGLGFSRYTYHYFLFPSNATFDFDEINAVQLIGSPRFVHEYGFWNIGLDFMYGLGNQRKGHAFQGVSIGYRRGWQPREWNANNTDILSPISDTSGQIYVSAVFGLSINYQKKN